MREARIKEAGAEALAMWMQQQRDCAAVVTRQECRTADGKGRADAIVAGRCVDNAVITGVVEAKSRFERGALAVFRRTDSGPMWTNAGLQLMRYPGNYRVLACPENLLTDHKGDRALLQALCARDGLGLLTVNWYREWTWLLPPRHAPTPPLWADCLEGYAAGPELRARVWRAEK